MTKEFEYRLQQINSRRGNNKQAIVWDANNPTPEMKQALKRMSIAELEHMSKLPREKNEN